jgi:hypothetical protein
MKGSEIFINEKMPAVVSKRGVDGGTLSSRLKRDINTIAYFDI